MRLSTATSLVAVAATQLFDMAMADPTAAAAAPSQTPSTLPMPGQRTSQGCYHAQGNWTEVQLDEVSTGKCNKACLADDYWVTALHGASCYCGWEYPPADSLSDDSDCSYPCPQYPLEACGSLGNPGYYTVFNTGININVENVVPDEGASTTSSSDASKTSTPAQQSTNGGAQTTTSSANKDKQKDDSDGGGTNVAAVAAGVVVGVVVIAALIGGGWFYMRRKRNAEAEEEHRRNAAVNAFISGSKPPSSSGSISMTDSRLDPVMAHRRLSDGSIADNQDYSRRILRVTNA